MRNRVSRVRSVLVPILMFGIVIYVLIAAVSWVGGHLRSPVVVTPATALNEGWNMDVTKPQPLILGGTADGATGESSFTTWRSLFSSGSRAEGSIHPGSAIRLEVKDNRYSYNVEVPRNLINWDRSAATPEEATITWGTTNRIVVYKIPHCEEIGNFFLAEGCQKWGLPSIELSEGWPATKRLGLGQFLNKFGADGNIDTVTIRVTEEQYQTYFRE